MSWDILILHPESAVASADGADGDPRLRPLGMADEVRRAVSRALPGIEWDAPVQGSYRGAAVDVDVELPSQGVVDSFALHLRGAANPMPFIVRICRQNGWVAFDSAAGSFLDLKSPEGWERGLRFRTQIQALSQLHRESPVSGRLGRRQLLWLVPLLLTLHNLEEALFMPGFLERFADRMPSFLAGLVPDIKLSQFLSALVLVTLVPYLFAASGRLERRSRAFYLVLGTQMVVLINVAAHTAGAVWMRGYVPGLATALLVNLPFSVYLFRRALQSGWVRWREMVCLVLAALLVHGPGLIGLLVLAGWATGG